MRKKRRSLPWRCPTKGHSSSSSCAAGATGQRQRFLAKGIPASLPMTLVSGCLPCRRARAKADELPASLQDDGQVLRLLNRTGCALSIRLAVRRGDSLAPSSSEASVLDPNANTLLALARSAGSDVLLLVQAAQGPGKACLPLCLNGPAQDSDRWIAIHASSPPGGEQEASSGSCSHDEKSALLTLTSIFWGLQVCCCDVDLDDGCLPVVFASARSR